MEQRSGNERGEACHQMPRPGAFDGSLATGAEANELIARLATGQHGVVARWQLIDLGIGGRRIQGYLQRGLLHQLHHGVYAVGHTCLSRYGRWLAAVLACGPGAHLSHSTAAALWGLRGERGQVEVLRRSGSSAAHQGVLLHCDRKLQSADLTREHGIPVVRPERAILQISAGLDVKQITRCLSTAERNRILRWPELERMVAATTAKGSRRLRRAMAGFRPAMAETASVGELDFLLLASHYGLPEPAVNVLLHGLVVDFYWADRGVVVEYDGFKYHGDRIAFERDRMRDVLLERYDIKVVRVTYQMLRDDPARVFATLKLVLARRSDWARTHA